MKIDFYTRNSVRVFAENFCGRLIYRIIGLSWIDKVENLQNYFKNGFRSGNVKVSNFIKKVFVSVYVLTFN